MTMIKEFSNSIIEKFKDITDSLCRTNVELKINVDEIEKIHFIDSQEIEKKGTH